VLLALSHRGC